MFQKLVHTLQYENKFKILKSVYNKSYSKERETETLSPYINVNWYYDIYRWAQRPTLMQKVETNDAKPAGINLYFSRFRF